MTEINKGAQVEIGQVSLEYMMDTKGYYQPVYMFEARADEELYDIKIPAIK